MQMAHKQLMDMISSLKERESDCVVEERKGIESGQESEE
jgi:hypothetical protein